MHCTPRLLTCFTVALLLLEGRGSRYDDATAMTLDTAGQHSYIASEADQIDFTFMTEDYRYPGHNAGFFGTIKEWFGNRAVDSDVKEEIVAKHTCQNRGNRDETYYASSFCYWLPEFDLGARPRNSGLLWTGGAYKTKSLGGALSGAGKCLKLAVCHNNAQSVDGDVDTQAFAETLPLPAGCLKERQIEKHCINGYNEVVADLKQKYDKCHYVENRYQKATRDYRKCMAELESLPRVIAQYPARIRRAEDDLIRQEARFRSAEDLERDERRQMVRRCKDYEDKKGWHTLHAWATGATNTEIMLSNFNTHCNYPQMPVDNHDGQHWDEMVRYRANVALHEACRECKGAKSDLKRASGRTRSARRQMEAASRIPPKLQREMAQRQRDLQDWQVRQPSLEHELNSMKSEWLPQQTDCQQTYEEYKNGKTKAVKACAPQFYNQSCERACTQLQAADGCGIVEGSKPGDATGNGGVVVQCSPPQPSWILSPWTYGAAPESSDDTCKRIDESQKVQYAETILKAGWLWKKGRLQRWDKRYFVLQSGDSVRSSVLRYWPQDPTKIISAQERVGKIVILHDAKGVKAKDGQGYDFKGGEECFKVYHFYRDFRFCVVVEELDAEANVLQVRDEWLQLIEDSIGKSE